MRWAAVLVAVSLLCLLLPRDASAQAPSLHERARESVVYVYFDVVDPQTGAKGRVQGTGFVVSPAGYVLTAAHLFRAWRQQTDASKAANKIMGTRFDKPGFVFESPLFLEPIHLGDPDAEDVALLKLPHITTYKIATVCLAASDRLLVGDSFTAYGFPADQSFQPIPGIFGTQNAPGGRWAAASAFTEGMSGGPIYGPGGTVVGIVKGGLTNTDAVRYITPIRHASSSLMDGGAPDGCVAASAGPANPVPDIEEVLWAFLQENYSTQSAINFLKRFPNSKHKAELEIRMAATTISSADGTGRVQTIWPTNGADGAAPRQYWTFKPGQPRLIPVCWESTDGFTTEREWVRTAIGESWELFSNIRFVGWSKCQPNQNAVRIATADTYPHAKALGPEVAGKPEGVVLNFEFNKWSSTCKSRRESCIRGSAVHEFGHVLGFQHENDRPDAPEACRRLGAGTAFVGKLLTPYDPSSVMNNCNPVFANNGALSPLDQEKVRILYGGPAPL